MQVERLKRRGEKDDARGGQREEKKSGEEMMGETEKAIMSALVQRG